MESCRSDDYRMPNNGKNDIGEPYENLAYAIVKLAVKDMKSLLKKKSRAETRFEKEACDAAIKRIEKFFLSDYGDIICFGCGETIIDRLHNMF